MEKRLKKYLEYYKKLAEAGEDETKDWKKIRREMLV